MILVTRFEYPHVNDSIIERQRRMPEHRLVGTTASPMRWPEPVVSPQPPVPTFHRRAGRRSVARLLQPAR